MKFNLKDFLELDTRELFSVNGGYYCTGSSSGASQGGDSSGNGQGSSQSNGFSVTDNGDGTITVRQRDGNSFTYRKNSKASSSSGSGYCSGASDGKTLYQNPYYPSSKKDVSSTPSATTTGGSCSSSGCGSDVPPKETDRTNPVEVNPTAPEKSKNKDNSVSLNAGWQVTSDSNSFTMYEYENSKKDAEMNGEGNFFSTDGCKMTGAAKIAQDLTGNDVSILNVNDDFDSNDDGLLTRYEIENGINNLLKGQECADKKVVSNRIEGSDLSKETFDNIVKSKDTVYVLGCCEFTNYNAEKKETYITQHWVVLEGMHSGEYGQYVFNVDGTSKYDSNRVYVFGDVPVSEKDSVRHITKIETFTLTAN